MSSSKQAVKVIIRTRPTNDFAQKNLEIDPAKGNITIKFDKNEAAGCINNQTDAWKFDFEKILHNSSQDEVYESSASEIVQSVVDGYNGTVFCYGQTGAGKTYTMTGYSNLGFKYRGIVPRAINQVYALTNSKFEQNITIRVSYAEIYNDQIRDLLPEVSGHGSENLMA
jgi:kinesin family member 6/9